MNSFSRSLMVTACLSLSASLGVAQDTEVFTQQQDVVIAQSHGLAVPMDIFVPSGDKNGLAIVDVASGAWHSDRGKIRK